MEYINVYEQRHIVLQHWGCSFIIRDIDATSEPNIYYGTAFFGDGEKTHVRIRERDDKSLTITVLIGGIPFSLTIPHYYVEVRAITVDNDDDE